MKNLKLNKVMVALFAVSTLGGVAFAETDAEKIERLELELSEYKTISNKYKSDLVISHEQYTEYRIEMDNSYKLLQQELTQKSEKSYKIFDEEKGEFESELKEEVGKTEDVKNNLSDIQNKIKSLENKEEKLKNEKNNLTHEFTEKIKNLNQELVNQTKKSTDDLDQKIKELDISTQNEAVLKKQLYDIIAAHKKELSDARLAFKESERQMIEHYKTVGAALEARLKTITTSRSVTVEQLRKNIEDISRMTARLKVNPAH